MKRTMPKPEDGSMLKKILLFSLPLMATGILQLLYSAADLIVVGQFASPSAMGSVGACASMINLIVGSCMGLSVGVGIAVAYDIGAGAHDRIGKVVTTSFVTALISGAAIALLGFVFSKDLLVIMNTPETLIDGASAYMRAYFLGVPGAMIYNYLASVLRSAGDTKRPLLFLAVSGVVNVIFNLITVIWLDMGAMGVGIATTVSQYVSVLMIVVYMTRMEGPLRIVWKGMCVDGSELRRILRMGVPSCIQSMCFSISNVMIQSTINRFGQDAVEAGSASASVEDFLYICLYSIVQASIVFAGQAAGAGRFDRLRGVLRACVICTLVTGIAMATLMMIFSRELIGLYAPGAESVISLGVLRMWCLCPLYFIYGLMAVGSGMLQGIGRPVLPMVITLLGTCVLRLVWVFGLDLFFPTCFDDVNNIVYLYICYPITWIVTMVAQFISYFVVKKKLTTRLI